ncbi:MAG: 50S ribosomal protein L31 [Candidatus Omnitrophica bacterium]|nr:50S ribosomal protein L31 [Candidatus Omnitrophota bacterium]
MKEKIHPEYGKTAFRCACGNVIETRSVIRGNMQVDVCSACHPFFTGKQKLMDTAGRIDRFKKKFGSKIALGGAKKVKKVAPKKAKEVEEKPVVEKQEKQG